MTSRGKERFPTTVLSFTTARVTACTIAASPPPKRELAADTVTCYAESSDGVHWNKPELGIVSEHQAAGSVRAQHRRRRAATRPALGKPGPGCAQGELAEFRAALWF